MEYLSKSSLETKRIGKKLAEKIIEKKKQKALTLSLEGDLGGGKTTFLQGFAEGLGIKEKVLSPTFVIIRRFKIPFSKRKSGGFKCFLHLDCYRIKEIKEILELGIKEDFSNSENVIAIEWGDRIKKIFPQKTIYLKFIFINKNTRKIIIKNG
jgi:tRNA threonylcarbamoyladenosine biosynthesis protein TsaE